MRALLVVLLCIPPAAVAVSLFGRARLAQAATLAAGAAAFGLSVALSLAVRHGRVLGAFAGWLRLDSLGAVFMLATGFLYLTTAAFSIGYLHADRTRRDFEGFARRYFAYLNLFGWTMLMVTEAADFGSLWIAVELTTIVSALMVALDRTDAALEASWKYVLIASTGLGIALLAIIVLYATGSRALGSSYLPRFESVLQVAHTLPSGAVKFTFLLAAVGFGTKVGFVPVHTWLPDAHSEAPSPVSALLSGALLVDAFYAVLRFFQVAAANGSATFASRVLIVLGALSLVVASLYVLRQRNYKRLLAYSSIEHMGVIALGVGFGVPLAVFGALLHVINHAAAKGLAFFGAGSILRRYDTKEIAHVEGAVTAMPWTGPMFLAAALALSGLPISGVFRSEFQIVSGGFAHPSYVWVALLIVLVNVAFLGVIWHVGRMTLSAATGRWSQRREMSWWMVAAMLVCLVVVVGIGLHVPASLHELLSNASTRILTPSA
jgi:hydrogenase-4 component F